MTDSTQAKSALKRKRRVSFETDATELAAAEPAAAAASSKRIRRAIHQTTLARPYDEDDLLIDEEIEIANMMSVGAEADEINSLVCDILAEPDYAIDEDAAAQASLTPADRAKNLAAIQELIGARESAVATRDRSISARRYHVPDMERVRQFSDLAAGEQANLSNIDPLAALDDEARQSIEQCHEYVRFELAMCPYRRDNQAAALLLQLDSLVPRALSEAGWIARHSDDSGTVEYTDSPVSGLIAQLWVVRHIASPWAVYLLFDRHEHFLYYVYTSEKHAS